MIEKYHIILLNKRKLSSAWAETVCRVQFMCIIWIPTLYAHLQSIPILMPLSLEEILKDILSWF